MIKRCSLPLLAATTFLFGCTSQAYDDETMYEKASALTKVSSALEASVYFDNPPENLRDRALLEYATQHDAALLDLFNGTLLKADHHNQHGIVLVCDEFKGEALMMDLGCTAKLDGQYWNTPEQEPCQINPNWTSQCPGGDAELD
ncbi:hypothetical protein MIH18_01750 [Marinobacter sp. M3C]|jgi:hypothetical protein|uniref:hypothetical protein n=1 Tax=Marinobacter sp. M3C TaxID=2917715 RepID=UPI00201046B6|nr:hypothetical protein [Marinobacter sp. M3C]UQG60708.1 hypothetical protein MIH18_01750 [Marinobacter sp. M3C]